MWSGLRAVALLTFLLIPSLCGAEELSIPGSNGGRLSVIADFPVGKGPFPAIVLAPGMGYHMRLPALAETAKALAAHGVAVFRFDWSYFTAKLEGQPSQDLSKELQDLQAVLAAVRRHPKVASKNVSVGGKSLGSLVAWRAFAADASLRSGLFLTPLCGVVLKGETVPAEARKSYPGFETERRPTLFVTGSSDPLCAAPALYQFAASGSGAGRVAIVEGDHGYEEPGLAPPAAEAARKRNIAAVAALAAAFVTDMTGERPLDRTTPKKP
jgi:predicted alpha/beta-hydrolase family hydrolase